MSYNSPRANNEFVNESLHLVFGSTVKRSSEDNLPSAISFSRRSTLSSKICSGDSSPIPLMRNRCPSKDSGISGHVSFAAKPAFFPTDHDFSLDLSLGSDVLNHNDMSSPILKQPASPHNCSGMFKTRRTRTTSESSDVDAEEVLRTGNSGLLHHLMHENQKPSCTDHPTNLDQEIGQSILGQIHHELARLHEAGRFLKVRADGGWSCGLGTEDDFCTNSSKIDWSSVVFHESHAAQLGCLEAMIVMAHYYLGLPSALLYDCPIESSLSDVGLGIDYLWRSAEGGDRRCMILLARYLDSFVTVKSNSIIESRISEFSRFMTTPIDLISLPKLVEARSIDNGNNLVSNNPLSSNNPWSEALMWYRKCVDKAAEECSEDEGLDAEGRYDSANDLLPVYRILARMAEMNLIGGYGLTADPLKAGYLFNEAGECAMSINQGQLALKYFELSEESWSFCPDEDGGEEECPA